MKTGGGNGVFGEPFRYLAALQHDRHGVAQTATSPTQRLREYGAGWGALLLKFSVICTSRWKLHRVLCHTLIMHNSQIKYTPSTANLRFRRLMRDQWDVGRFCSAMEGHVTQLAILCIMSAMVGVGVGVAAPLIPLLIQTSGASDAQVGMAASSMFASIGVSALAFGAITEESALWRLAQSPTVEDRSLGSSLGRRCSRSRCF
jgi:hypothetical protein